jgi:hypothetical protein
VARSHRCLANAVSVRRIIGLGFLFTFYDVFDINVSFIQSCVALKPGCSPVNALNTIRVPIALPATSPARSCSARSRTASAAATCC